MPRMRGTRFAMGDRPDSDAMTASGIRPREPSAVDGTEGGGDTALGGRALAVERSCPDEQGFSMEITVIR